MAASASTPRWRVCLLGDVQVRDARDETLGRLPSRAVTLLLARLAMAPQRAHAREELIDLLWPEVDLDVGRNRLRQVLSTLKSLLEPAAAGPASAVLVADRVAVRVAPGALACDAVDFEAAVRARQRSAARALYRGPLMPGFFDEWVQEERQRLEALADRMDFDALETTPAPAAADAPAAAQTVSSTLPSYLTRLHGADAIVAQLREAVQAERLVAITGPGGSGKTRLAIECARSLSTSGFDPIAFVPLAGAADRESVIAAMAAVLRAEASRAGLATALAGRRALLVVDNCEQVLDAAAGELAALLEHTPSLHVLATSRRALALDGECVFALPPLPTPGVHESLVELAQNASVNLFADRARIARADFHLGPRNAAAVAGLVRWLGGLPLAIELAAARVRSVGPAQMLALLEQSGSEALTLVARAGPRGGDDARHASMVAVIDWSWRLLDDSARCLIADMSLFPGGFTLEAASRVGGMGVTETAGVLDVLVEHSFLRPALDGERFAAFEVIREFSAAHVAPARAAAVRVAQRQWLLEWARALALTPPLDAVRAEMLNIVAMLEGAVADGAACEAIELLAVLRRCFEDVELPAAGLHQLERAIDACADAVQASRGHTLVAALLFNAGEAASALRHAEAGLAAAAVLTKAQHARALHALASVRWRSTKQAHDVLPLIDQAEVLAESAVADDVLASLCALRAFIVGQHLRDAAQAEALHARATELWRRQGNQHAVNSGLYNLAVVASRSGQAERALALIAAVLDSAQRHGDSHRARQALNVKGNALVALRRWREAAEVLRECVQQSWAAMATHDLAYGLWNLPRVLAHQRQHEAAVRIAACAAHLWTRHFGTFSAADRHDLRLVRRLSRLSLSQARVDALWHEGEQMPLADAVALALATR